MRFSGISMPTSAPEPDPATHRTESPALVRTGAEGSQPRLPEIVQVSNIVTKKVSNFVTKDFL